MMVIRGGHKRIANFLLSGFSDAWPTIGGWRWGRTGILGALLLLAPAWAAAQTPSPLQEWQYSGGVALEKLFEPNLPNWRTVLGGAVEDKPLYDGASLTRTSGGPLINIRYKDFAFVSVGEGVGLNLLHGDHYRGGLALTYDLGRLESNDISHLHGLGDINRAPAPGRVHASYAVSKSFPPAAMVRMDVRQIIGGADGMLADIDAYMPLPGSSKHLIMFAGPSPPTPTTAGDMQKEFGVTASINRSPRVIPSTMRTRGRNAMGFLASAPPASSPSIGSSIWTPP